MRPAPSRRPLYTQCSLQPVYHTPAFFCANETHFHGTQIPRMVTEATKTPPFHLFLAKSDCERESRHTGEVVRAAVSPCFRGLARVRTRGAAAVATRPRPCAKKELARRRALRRRAQSHSRFAHLEHESRVVGVAAAAHAHASTAGSDTLRQLREDGRPANAQQQQRQRAGCFSALCVPWPQRCSPSHSPARRSNDGGCASAFLRHEREKKAAGVARSQARRGWSSERTDRPSILQVLGSSLARPNGLGRASGVE